MTQTQYDSLDSTYDVFDRLPYREMEVANVHEAVRPLLGSDVKLLELACGSGFYTQKFLNWGVGEITGMDISEKMLARASSRTKSWSNSSKVRFVHADGSDIQSFAPNKTQGYFDLAFAAWLLNYAQNKEQLVAMFRNIAMNLRPGGVFAGIIPHPVDDFKSRADVYTRRPMNVIYPRNEYCEEIDGGVGRALHVFVNEEGVDFMTYHLKKSVIEECAREGGFTGRLEWRREFWLGEDWKKKYDFTDEEWKIRANNPHFGILMVWKA